MQQQMRSLRSEGGADNPVDRNQTRTPVVRPTSARIPTAVVVRCPGSTQPFTSCGCHFCALPWPSGGNKREAERRDHTVDRARRLAAALDPEGPEPGPPAFVAPRVTGIVAQMGVETSYPKMRAAAVILSS